VTVLYTFDDSRDHHDWNGFTALTWLEARTDTVGTSVEMQVPLFDLGMKRSTDARLLWQTGDSVGNDDLGDNIVSLQSDNIALDSAVSNARQAANSQNTSPVISIDGQFDDWIPVSKQSDGSGDAGNPNIDLSEYATTEQSGLTSFYLKVNGDVLAGVAIPKSEARSRPSGDLTGEPGGSGNQQSAPLPVDTSIDAIRLFFDTDDDPFTGYQGLEVQMGADVMIEITGHFGVISQRVIKAYTGDGDDFTWGSDTTIDAAAAGSEIELEAYLPGSADPYYIHLTSWDAWEDSVGSYQEAAEDGRGHGDPHIPTWNSGDWFVLGTDNTEGATAAVDIFDNTDGDQRSELMYYADGTYMYFMMFFEGSPDMTSYTYGAVLNDGASDGNNDYMVCTLYAGGTQYLAWYSWDTFSWSLVGSTTDTDWYRSSTTSGQMHVAFAVAYSVTFTPVAGEDYFKGVTDVDGSTQGSSWARNPIPDATEGDFTTSAAIPEFPTLLMPVLSVLLVVGLNYRRQRNTLASRPAQT
jgi:hypothetical protein